MWRRLRAFVAWALEMMVVEGEDEEQEQEQADRCAGRAARGAGWAMDE